MGICGEKKSMCMENIDPLMDLRFKLATAYVRIQTYCKTYSPEVGLMKGTIFPELYRAYPPDMAEEANQG